jgi:iron complex outermembrane receptor protein
MYAMLAPCLLCAPASAPAQSGCTFSVSGKVYDKSGQPVPGAIVRLFPDSTGTAADAYGAYLFTGVCAGQHIIACDETGYNGQRFSVNIRDSITTQDFHLAADVGLLHEVVVAAQRHNEIATATRQDISGLQLLQTRGSTLGESLKSITGLNSIQTGPSLSKPVIHGLHSNRVLILNNGVRQEGQQWGSEHAPEVDPFVAENITVIKGAASIRYGSDAIAGVVLLDAPPLPSQPGIRGDIYSVGASNGRMGTFSATLEGMAGKGLLKGLGWRVQGTLKRAGNFRTADYYLANTGLAEGDLSAAARYEFKGWDTRLFLSSYNTKIGIFAGSHVGNVADLNAAFVRSRPLTPDSFYYGIGRSYQTVNHQLVRLTEVKRINERNRIEANVTYQTDLRNEYDIDVPYSTNPDVFNAPQISFRLNTTTADFTYIAQQGTGFSGTFGVMGSTQSNVFKGLRYLVPNFRNYGGGAFAIEKWQHNRLLLEAGLRYDYEWLQVYLLNNNTLQTYHSTYTYQNPTATAGATYRFNNALHANLNFGTAWRAPSINELYIRGIHLSAASYEIGDSSLQSERSYNTSLSVHYHRSPLELTVDLYDNEINNFIYAQPTLKPVTLVTGTYPAFQYVQTDARLRGADINAQLQVLRHFTLSSKTSIVRGWNKSLNDWLIFMPADRFQNGIAYSLDSIGHRIRSPYISLENVLVPTQSRVPPNSDYVAPPAGYSIFNANVGCAIPLGSHLLHTDFGVQNLTNVTYRDYLNRFRYYADDLGINFILRLKLSF